MNIALATCAHKRNFKPNPMPALITELDDDLLQCVIDHLRERRALEFEKRETIDAELRKIDAKIDSIRAKMFGSISPELPISPVQLGPTGRRVKRGLSEKLISNFLQKQNGTGATITEIADAVKTKYPTTRRIIGELAGKNAVTQTDDSRWHWAGDCK